LRCFVHLCHRVGDLIDTDRLLMTGGGDLCDHVGNFLDAFDDLGERLAGLVDEIRAVLDLFDRVVDEILDFFGSAGAALCKRANFGSDDGETPALFAGARRFNRGVQRQQIGLEGDLVDDANDIGDAAAGSVDLAHCDNCTSGDGATFVSLAARP
jgi:hypothetical protein